MKIQPDYAEIRAAAAAGQYKVYPIHCELLSDFCTPIEALRILKNVSTHCFLLESILDREKLTLDNDTFENTGKSRFFERRTSRVLY